MSHSPQTQFKPVSENQLPQWARVGHLDKSRYPKPFTKDHFEATEADNNTDEADWFSADQNPAVRVQYLERSINFLRKEHQEVLANLHSEIEKLRVENKDLHFKFVMSAKESRSQSSTKLDDITRQSKPASEDQQLENYLREKTLEAHSEGGASKETQQYLEQQIVDLKHQIRELKSKNTYLMQVAESEKVSQPRVHKSANHSQRNAGSRPSACGSEISVDLDRLSTPKRNRAVVVHSKSSSAASRKPTQEELERIVHHMHTVNQQQAKELVKLKAELNEALYSHKWTSDASYLLAKAYVPEEGAAPHSNILPKLKTSARPLPDIAYIARDNVSLPALKTTMGTKASERRKRTQILQKARLHKEVS